MRTAAYAAHREQAKQAEQAGGRQGTGKAGTYQVAYQTVGHLISKRLRVRSSKKLRETARSTETLRDASERLREAPRSSEKL